MFAEDCALGKDLNKARKEVGDYYKMQDEFNDLVDKVKEIRDEKDRQVHLLSRISLELRETKKKLVAQKKAYVKLEKTVDVAAVAKSKIEDMKEQCAQELSRVEVKIRQEEANATTTASAVGYKKEARKEEKMEAEIIKTEGAKMRKQHQESVARRKLGR